MPHGFDAIETEDPPVAAPPPGPERLMAMINRLVLPFCSAALVAAAFVLTYSVVVRYILHYSTDWQDEMSVFLIIGAVFLSAAFIQERRGHVAIEAFIGLLPAAVDRVRRALVDLASMAFCTFFAWKSWTLLQEAWVEDYHSGSTWGPPLWIPYSLMAVGMTLLSLQLLLQVVAWVTSGRRGRPQ